MKLLSTPCKIYEWLFFTLVYPKLSVYSSLLCDPLSDSMKAVKMFTSKGFSCAVDLYGFQVA
jgi:hypothetical protein